MVAVFIIFFGISFEIHFSPEKLPVLIYSFFLFFDLLLHYFIFLSFYFSLVHRVNLGMWDILRSVWGVTDNNNENNNNGLSYMYVGDAAGKLIYNRILIDIHR